MLIVDAVILFTVSIDTTVSLKLFGTYTCKLFSLNPG